MKTSIKLIYTILSLLLLTISCKENNSNTKDYEIGFFDERSMSFKVLDIERNTIKEIVKIEDENSGWDRKISWSPNGEEFGFTGIVKGIPGTHIYTIDKGTTRTVMETNNYDIKNKEKELQFWHPDGYLIHHFKWHSKGDAGIYSVSLDGKIKDITRNEGKYWDYFPNLYPDGRIGYFSINKTEKSPVNKYYEINLDGAVKKEIGQIEKMDTPLFSSTISKDLKSMFIGEEGEIYQYIFHTKELKNLTNTPNIYELGVSLSNDGNSIIYSRSETPNRDPMKSDNPTMNIYRMSLKSLDVEQITFGDNYFTFPSFRPVHNKT